MRAVVADPERVWLSSYPKSGTTWMRYLLCGLVDGPPHSSRDVDRVVPCMHERGWRPRAAGQGPSLLHTHLSRDNTVARFGTGAAFILVVRHPIDVLWSNVNYFVMTQLGHYRRRFEGAPVDDAKVIRRLAEHYVHEYMRGLGDAQGLRIGYGSWSEHTRGWLSAQHEQNGLVVRYEDLKRDPFREVRRVSEFVGLAHSNEQLQRVVEGGSFEAMKGMEEREIAGRIEGRFYREAYREGHAAGLRFLHRGEVGRGARALSPEVIELVASDAGPVMAQLGYGIENGECVIHERSPAGGSGAFPLPASEPLRWASASGQ